MNEKLLNKIALYVQEKLKGKPQIYREIREDVMKQFNLTKVKAGIMLNWLARRKNFLSLTFGYRLTKQSILYLPDDIIEAKKMFQTIRDSIPFNIRYFNKNLHQTLIKEIRKIKIWNPELPPKVLIDVIKWKLKIHEDTAERLLKELE